MAVKFGPQTLSVSMLMDKKHVDATQLRRKVNGERAKQYAQEMNEGAQFPRPIVFFDSREQAYYVGDGFHRITAHEINGRKTIECEVRRGTRLDAMLWCLNINFRQQRGLSVAHGDKSNAVLMLLLHPEASQWNRTRIAQEVGCTGALVDHVIEKNGIDRPAMVLDKNDVLRPSTQDHGTRATSKQKRRLIKQLKLEGLSEEEIAERTGVPIEQVIYHARRAMMESDVVDCPHCNGTGKVRINAEAN